MSDTSRRHKTREDARKTQEGDLRTRLKGGFEETQEGFTETEPIWEKGLIERMLASVGTCYREVLITHGAYEAAYIVNNTI